MVKWDDDDEGSKKHLFCFFFGLLVCVFWDQTTGKNRIYMVHIGLFSHFFVGD